MDVVGLECKKSVLEKDNFEFEHSSVTSKSPLSELELRLKLPSRTRLTTLMKPLYMFNLYN